MQYSYGNVLIHRFHASTTERSTVLPNYKKKLDSNFPVTENPGKGTAHLKQIPPSVDTEELHPTFRSSAF